MQPDSAVDTPKQGKVTQRAIHTTGVTFTAAWLLLWYVVAIFLVLATLSAFQFKERVGRDDAIKMTVPRLVDLMGDIKALDIEERLRVEERRAATRQLGAERDTVSAALRSSLLAESNANQTADQVRIRIMELRGVADFFGPDPVYYEDLQVLVAEFGADVALATHWKAYNKHRADQEKALTEVNVASERIERIQVELRLNSEEVERVRTERAALLKGHPLGIHDYISDVDFLERVGILWFARMPTQLLTLFLTLAMGALGSVIYLTRAFFGRYREQPMSWYFFRPFLGIVTAFAIFILMKAGQLIITDSGGGNGASDNLNPFLVSFLAVVSGLFSEQAYARIQAAGDTLFKSPETDQPRWGYGLKAAAEGRVDDLLRYVSVQRKTLDRWIDETEPVPEPEQLVIAAFLNKSPRDLFTDIPPEGREGGDETPAKPRPAEQAPMDQPLGPTPAT